MSAILYKDNPYGGTTSVTDAGHVLVTEGSDTTTAQAKFNTQTTAIQRILGNFATVEQSTTASKAYNIGDYLVLNSFLYKVTQAIAAGDTIDNTQNGNVEKTSAGTEFGSGSAIELTQAQYDALTEEEKMDDVIYLITDSPDNYLDEVFGDFATVEYTNTASKAYAVGDYLVYDSKFYKVTSAISQGDTITPGTNVVKTTVADEFSNASNIDYSNTTSGLTATNVQSALDETNLDLGNLSSILSTKVQDNVRVINIKGTDLSALMNVDNSTFCFMVTRASIATAYVACLNRYNGTINVKEVYNSGSFTTVTNSGGTVSIRYNGDTMGVYGVGLLKLPS